MNYKSAEQSDYKYTDSFLKRKKLQKTLAPFVLLIIVSIAIAIGELSIIGAYSSILSVILVLGALIWLFGFSDVSRNFNGDKIYINDGLLCFEKCFVQRNWTYYKQYKVKNVEKIDVSTRDIKIYGVILYYNEGRGKLRKTLKLSADLINADELISYIKSIQTTNPQVISDSLSEFHGKKASTNIDRAMIWSGISKAFISLFIKKVLGGLLGIAVGLLCIYAIINGFDNIIMFLLLVGSFVTGLIISLLGFFNLISEYLPDLLFKRVLIYEGYLTTINPVDTTHNTTRYPISQYKSYYHVMFYEKPNVKDKYKPLCPGDIKSSPNGGQRLLLGDKTMFDDAHANQRFEVLYLNKSRIIVAVRSTAK